MKVGDRVAFRAWRWGGRVLAHDGGHGYWRPATVCAAPEGTGPGKIYTLRVLSEEGRPYLMSRRECDLISGPKAIAVHTAARMGVPIHDL